MHADLLRFNVYRSWALLVSLLFLVSFAHGQSLNTALGTDALFSNTTGDDNTAIGFHAEASNTSGGTNTAVGVYSVGANTTGVNNTAIGGFSLAGNTVGNANTALGYEALANNTTGSFNAATGQLALISNTTGTTNVADGGWALILNTTGYGNVATGYQALTHNVTGAYNTCIGAYCNVGFDGLTNATAIGFQAYVDQSNALVLGNNSVNVGIRTATPSHVFTIGRGAGVAIADGWTTYSSRRWKTNIQPLYGALEKVAQLRGVSYDRTDSGKHEVGVIAEEVGAVIPELVTWDANGKDAQGVDYSRLTAVLIEATKEQQSLIQKQQTQIEAQQTQISDLAAQLKTIRALLDTNSAK